MLLTNSNSGKQDLTYEDILSWDAQGKCSARCPANRSLILFEDMNTVFDEDRGFMSYILLLAETDPNKIERIKKEDDISPQLTKIVRRFVQSKLSFGKNIVEEGGERNIKRYNTQRRIQRFVNLSCHGINHQWEEAEVIANEEKGETEYVLKIIKHYKEFSPSLVTGQLLGLDVGSVLEVTNFFPFPISEEDDEIEADGASYQLEMMRCLREVNLDNNTVGWYQSTLLGSYQMVELIKTFMNYQLEACSLPFFDVLFQPNARFPTGRPLPPLFNFKQEISCFISQALNTILLYHKAQPIE